MCAKSAYKIEYVNGMYVVTDEFGDCQYFDNISSINGDCITFASTSGGSISIEQACIVKPNVESLKDLVDILTGTDEETEPEPEELKNCAVWINDYCAVDDELKLTKASILADALAGGATLPDGSTPTNICEISFALKPKGGEGGADGKKATASDAVLTLHGGTTNLDAGGVREADIESSEFELCIKPGSIVTVNAVLC